MNGGGIGNSLQGSGLSWSVPGGMYCKLHLNLSFNPIALRKAKILAVLSVIGLTSRDQY